MMLFDRTLEIITVLDGFYFLTEIILIIVGAVCVYGSCAATPNPKDPKKPDRSEKIKKVVSWFFFVGGIVLIFYGGGCLFLKFYPLGFKNGFTLNNFDFFYDELNREYNARNYMRVLELVCSFDPQGLTYDELKKYVALFEKIARTVIETDPVQFQTWANENGNGARLLTVLDFYQPLLDDTSSLFTVHAEMTQMVIRSLRDVW